MMNFTKILVATQPNSNIEDIFKRMKTPLTDPCTIV